MATRTTSIFFSLTPERMDIIQETNNKCWQGCRENEPCTQLVRMQISAANNLHESVWGFLKKNLKMRKVN
jgi:hypothetical protein